MRKLFILGVCVVFGLYCLAAWRNHTYVQVPDYEVVEVDLLGGRTPGQWLGPKRDADPEGYKEAERFRRQYLRSLEARKLQPPADQPLLLRGEALPPEAPLAKPELLALAAAAAAGGGRRTLRLRDPAAIIGLVKKDYLIRNPLHLRAAAGGGGKGESWTYNSGDKLDKPAIDHLLAAGRRRVSVIGSGQPVAPQPASMLMVMLIFLALAFALKDTLWEPLLSLIDKRQADLARGGELAKANRDEAARLEGEVADLRRRLRREHAELLNAARARAREEAAAMLAQARAQARAQRQEAEERVRAQLQAARNELMKEVPTLARHIVGQVTDVEQV